MRCIYGKIILITGLCEEILRLISCRNRHAGLSLDIICLFAAEPDCKVCCRFFVLASFINRIAETVDAVRLLSIEGRKLYASDLILNAVIVHIFRNHIRTCKVHSQLSAFKHRIGTCFCKGGRRRRKSLVNHIDPTLNTALCLRIIITGSLLIFTENPTAVCKYGLIIPGLEIYRAGKRINPVRKSRFLQLLCLCHKVVITHVICRIAYPCLIKNLLIVPERIGIKVLRYGIVFAIPYIVVDERLGEIVLDIGLLNGIRKIRHDAAFHIAVGMKNIHPENIRCLSAGSCRFELCPILSALIGCQLYFNRNIRMLLLIRGDQLFRHRTLLLIPDGKRKSGLSIRFLLPGAVSGTPFSTAGSQHTGSQAKDSCQCKPLHHFFLHNSLLFSIFTV